MARVASEESLMPERRSVHSVLATEARAGSLTRRRALIGLVGLATAVWVAQSRATKLRSREPDTDSLDDWRAFTVRYVAPEGRVVDTGNGGVTHSEGQGYGLLFAEHFADRATFDSLLNWTQANLRRSGDALHAWRFKPNASVPVDDINNATDGDLLIAWALLRAGQRWDNQDYTDLGTSIAGDLLANCVREVGGATLLLPAAFGFEHPGRVIINPSYYIFPALAALADAVPDPAWARLQADGLRLLRLARFGCWRLPTDWVEIVDGAVEQVMPAAGWPARFSWDAVRVPLNLAWAGLTDEPAFGAAADFWGDRAEGRPPAWTDVSTNAVAPFAASRGVTAIAELARVSRSAAADPDLPHVGEAEDYFSAALVLLARIVWQEHRAAAATA
jgi:endoglucanase